MYWSNIQRDKHKVLCQKSKYAQENLQDIFQGIIHEAHLDLISVDIFGLLPKSKAGVYKFTTLYPVVHAKAHILLGRVNSFV
ncbi:hypothetical protein PR048_018682 [Dryococelus australis]|uniref:Uncharacterized protein n=1 Tax=Dryococelus australis TaxID=614101 RepID=A0ABQ9HD52_9NEOP|nr:hypothetical protein PR048_018682 [Dryococelus australis]